jgi:hypothetical protein
MKHPAILSMLTIQAPTAEPKVDDKKKMCH